MISRLRAIAVLGKVPVAGFPAWVLWLFVRLTALAGFKNRVSVLFNWTIAFLGRGRAQRVITAQQVFAREASKCTRVAVRMSRRYQRPLA